MLVHGQQQCEKAYFTQFESMATMASTAQRQELKAAEHVESTIKESSAIGADAPFTFSFEFCLGPQFTFWIGLLSPGN